jgi:O-antigen/teichoic acid export membrane protein
MHTTASPTASPGSTVRLNFSWMLFGSFGYALSQGVVLALLAKLGSAEMVGQFALGLAIAAPVFLFSNLSLRTVQATEPVANYPFRRYLCVRCISLPLAIASVLGIIAVAGLARTTIMVVFLVAVSKAVEAFGDVYHGRLQRVERMDVIGKSLLLRGAASVCAVGGALYFTGDIVWAVASLALSWLVTTVLVDVRAGSKLDAASSEAAGWSTACAPPELARLVRTALPMGFVACLISLSAALPRYVLGTHHGEVVLGLFAGMAYLAFAGAIVVNSMVQATLPRMASLSLRREYTGLARLLRNMIAGSALWGAIGVVAAITIGPQVLRLVYSEEFSQHPEAFIIIMAAGAVGYIGTVLSMFILAARRFRTLLVMWLAICAVSAIASIGLIPRFGLQGAAWSGMATAVAHSIIAAAVTWRVRRTPPNLHSSHLAVTGN